MAESKEKKGAKRTLKDAKHTLKETRKLILNQERSLKIINIITECAENQHKGDERTDDGDYENAITCFDKVLDCCKRLAKLPLKDKVPIQLMAKAWRSKGIALENLGKHRQASKCYKKALKTYPDLYKDEIVTMIGEALRE